MRDDLHVPVLVAGGGPVGLAVAALLARHGIASRVIEADAGYCTGSRAICLSRRSLEVLDWAGAAAAIVAKGLGWRRGRSFFRDEEVLQFEMPNAPDDRFAPMTNIQQFSVEEAVHRAASAHGGLAQVEWGTSVEEVERSADGVRLHCRRGSEPVTFSGDWLVACDGGRSRVREALGLSLHGTTYEGRYVIVDIRQKSKRPTERLAWFDPPTNRGSTVLMHRQPDDVWRIDYQLRDDEDPEQAVRPENVLPRVAAHLQWIGETEPWDVQWISIYNAKCLTLDAYRHGRVLFAGDAAHLVPIFGVRGLNSGLDDAGNLAWKLAAVIRGQANDALLDTYSQERRAAALVNIAFGSRSTEFMAPPHRGFSLLREAVLRLAGSDPVVRNLINPRQTAPVPYDCALLLGPDEGFTSKTAAPGFVAPEAPLACHGQHGFVTQCFGSGWTVLAFDHALDVRGASVVPVDSAANQSLAQRYEAVPGTAYVMRPDGYVAARWKQARAADVQAVLDRWSRDAGS
jgi:3-(3-hydroxy-phenyl)propionate hydroxylase